MYHDVIVRPHLPGRFTATVWGIPDLRAEAATEQEAVELVKAQLTGWLAAAKWVRVDVAAPLYVNPAVAGLPAKDPNDPMEREYLEELARMKKEDLERTLREYEQKCPKDLKDPVEHEYWKALVARMRRDMPDMAGHAKDDPFFDEYLEEIARARREEDEREMPVQENHLASLPKNPAGIQTRK